MNSGILSWLSNGPILSSYDFLLPPLLGRPAEALLEAADKKKTKKNPWPTFTWCWEKREEEREEGRVRSRNVTEMKKKQSIVPRVCST